MWIHLSNHPGSQPHNKPVLVQTLDGRILTAEWDAGWWTLAPANLHGHAICDIQNVIAWRPLPMPTRPTKADHARLVRLALDPIAQSHGA